MMQRFLMNSARVTLLSSCSKTSAVFRPSIRALMTSSRMSSTPITPSKQTLDHPPPSYARTFKLERQIFVASLPLLPIAYFVHGPVMDTILTIAIVANCHFGAHAVITDYARPIVVGERFAKVAHYGAYLTTALLLAGLLHFNYNDVGLTRAFELFFSL